VVKTAAASAPPKFKAKSLVECKREGEGSIKGVVVECNGSSVTVLDTFNQVRTFEDASVNEVKASFVVVSQDKNGRTVRCSACMHACFLAGNFGGHVTSDLLVSRRGDTVKLVGDSISQSINGSFVRVEFIINTELIIFSPSITSNRGLMAVPSSCVEAPSAPKVDPSMPAPYSGGGNFGGNGGGNFGGNGESMMGGGGGNLLPGGFGIGIAVRIIKGVHKGKDGVIRKIMGNKMSVQARHVSSRSDLM
jgi:hypothetical protein